MSVREDEYGREIDRMRNDVIGLLEKYDGLEIDDILTVISEESIAFNPTLVVRKSDD